jgi:nitrous oxide reductase accessory protein NosL
VVQIQIREKKMIDDLSLRHRWFRFQHLLLVILLLVAAGCYAPQEAKQQDREMQTAVRPPQVIPDTVSCGNCGMYPARYPKWQTQIVFTDGSMMPFDGCKCMFGFMFQMDRYDTRHTIDDVAAVWVKDYGSGDWMQAAAASYVVGSDVMGPMGKELIPFGAHADAVAFQKENNGTLAEYDSIDMDTLKALMHGMKMQGHGHHGH